MFLDIVALHLGALHPYEKVLTLLLAFGPFVLLGIVVAVRRRQDAAEDAAAEAAQEPGEGASEPATRGRPGSPS
ncbi:hypothetical protein SAMN04487968_101426 [Nocardioides terrae]|uniref:Uncharacterized protein n=1 Tax=Nocardioides terrae TaxID=574651 RepID=A0A1I1DPT4_9ACTN|nr:hypothetical protein [Nocardioides terrae]SFB77009.1 hypothetical protein SAMN04487968_101426 [Nocardioides terrae]